MNKQNLTESQYNQRLCFFVLYSFTYEIFDLRLSFNPNVSFFILFYTFSYISIFSVFLASFSVRLIKHIRYFVFQIHTSQFVLAFQCFFFSALSIYFLCHLFLSYLRLHGVTGDFFYLSFYYFRVECQC